MKAKAIKQEIRKLKAEMKANNIRVISFMNTGLTSDESRYNCRLFQLKNDLRKSLA